MWNIFLVALPGIYIATATCCSREARTEMITNHIPTGACVQAFEVALDMMSLCKSFARSE